ncbi:two-component system OmpR family response regulator [Cryobacterium mesophilum]|uniref:Response regulator transcription factor n=1 Tax=Terrimesophilobacter mesophilus TaxID=433647 RepID=A0A4R8VA42_9MICO|nr:response regulator transcription factor [Terrimesophilobacter mesophilus]MBB5631974.1 two-component system OmpR family response regulator [Terrimesophilobacter mesophilus]TFB78872.1 response regulator transcription factor [Terrimesophilobacter mesophilus]
MHILVVEDDSEMGALLVRGLTEEGHRATLVSNGVDALVAAQEDPPALAVIDVMLPGMNGFEVCRRLRESAADVALLLLTARSSVEDRVFGLDAGADDYVTKPFAFAELNARVRALLRRDNHSGMVTVSIGSLNLDSLSQSATIGGKTIALSPKEFVLLRLLAMNPGQLVTRNRILTEVWGGTEHIDTNIVDQYLSYLRRKLSQSASGLRIATVRGEGYILDVA